MKQGIAVGAGVVALGIFAAGAAHAQGFYVGPPRIHGGPPPMFDERVVPPPEILMLVRAAGLTPLTQPARRGHRYLLLASDRMGGQLRVVVNAYDGRIMRVVPANDPRFAYHPVRPPATVPVPGPHYGAPPPPNYRAAPHERHDPPPVVYGSREGAPRPPLTTGSVPDQRRAPDHRLAAAPPAADPAPPRPARTPLPRPRPAAIPPKAKEQPKAPAVAANNATARDTSPEAETSPPPAAAQPRPAPTAGQSAPAAPPKTETVLVPVAPLE
jgi:hypothetical protein